MRTNSLPKIAAISVSFCMLFNLVFHTSIMADTITIASDKWCPVSCEPGSKNPGFMVEMAQSIFAKAGHRIEYKKIPWARTLLMVRHGDIHGAIGAYINDAPDFIFPDKEQAMIGFHMFTSKDNSWTYKGLSSLDNILLGAIKDYSYLDEIDAYIGKNKNNRRRVFLGHGDDPLKKNTQLLLYDRRNAIIETDLVFWHVATQMGVQNKLKSAGIAAKPNKAYIAFSPALPKSKEYARILSIGMVELRKTGELEKIINKYDLTDWKK